MKMIALSMILTLMATAGCTPMQTTPVTPTTSSLPTVSSLPAAETPKVPVTAPAKPAEKPKPKEPQAPPTKAQINACVQYAKEKYEWKDKESVRADSAKWADGEGGPKGGVLVLELNAKNSYGAYGGTNSAVCQLNGNKAETMGYIKEKGGIIWR